jgi:N-acyl-D-amino-acid deacylase
MGSRTLRWSLQSVLVACAVLGLVAETATPQGGPPYDLVFRNGRVLDGSGNPWIRADVAIRGDRIVAVGRLGGAAARRSVDVGDRYVAPGFIDVHSHAAEGLVREELRQGQPLLAQGITTIVGNPDGGGPVDLAAQRAELERGIGVNVALLIGHGSVRRAVMGDANRPPTEDELGRMEDLVRAGMREGAFGLSSGLFYVPGRFATTEEVIALAKVAADAGGLYTSHIRDEGDYSVGVVASVQEVIRIAEQAHLVGIVSHMKALGPDSWGLSAACLARIDRARARGVSVFADQYPYDASSTSLSAALVPGWGRDDTAAGAGREVAPAARSALVERARVNLERRGGATSIVIARYDPDPGLEGLSLADIARNRGRSPEDTVLDLLARADASIVSFNMSEDDIVRIMREPYTMTSSDGGLVKMGEGKPHPRNYGAFARKLAVYVRDRRVIGLEDAVRSMTGLPAAVFGFPDRGAIRPGAAADLVVFDLDAVSDRATYADPHRLAVGMSWVVVNGRVAIEDGAFTTALAGKVIRRP